MKICIAIHSIDKNDGGPSRSVPLLARGLSECGVQVTLLTKHTNSMNLELLKDSQVIVKILNQNASYPSLVEYFKHEHFDIIHSQNLWLPFYHYIARIARKNGIPYIMTPRGSLEPWSLTQKKLKKKLALKIYQRYDLNNAACVLATAKMEAESIRKIGINSPIAVIPNGLDIKEYTCRPIEHKKSVKKQILFLSRIHKKKGIELLITAWSKLASKYKDWEIIITGNGDEEYILELKNQIQKEGLKQSIKIIEPVYGKEKIKLYQNSAIFVLPTYSENFGMVVAEAMSCGVPVITTKGTPWSILNEQGLGWCISLSANNLILSLSEAIDSGIDNLFELGQKSSSFINNTLGYNKIAQKMKEVYEWILDSNYKPDCIQI